jgi:hypothetical protein
MPNAFMRAMCWLCSSVLLARSQFIYPRTYLRGALTKYSSVLTTVPIDYIHWDNSNHVFALSASTGKLYVWTATPTTITPVSGSPFTIKATKDANGNYATALAVR